MCSSLSRKIYNVLCSKLHPEHFHFLFADTRHAFYAIQLISFLRYHAFESEHDTSSEIESCAQFRLFGAKSLCAEFQQFYRFGHVVSCVCAKMAQFDRCLIEMAFELGAICGRHSFSLGASRVT